MGNFRCTPGRARSQIFKEFFVRRVVNIGGMRAAYILKTMAKKVITFWGKNRGQPAAKVLATPIELLSPWVPRNELGELAKPSITQPCFDRMCRRLINWCVRYRSPMAAEFLKSTSGRNQDGGRRGLIAIIQSRIVRLRLNLASGCTVDRLMHFQTADADKTRLSCLVLSASAVWNEFATSQDCRQQKISKLNMFSFSQFCPVSKCGVNRVLSCLDPVSNLQLGRWRHARI